MWVHGGDLLTMQQRIGQRNILDFSANINPLGQPVSVRKAIEGSASASVHYPDPFCRELKQAISAFEDVKSDWVTCGNGAADMIFKIAYGLKPREASIPAPTFSEYENAMKQVGAGINYHALDEKTDFRLSYDVLDSIRDSDIIFLCNPNNPVGNTLQMSLLASLLHACKQRDTLLVIDECFMDLVQDGCSAKVLLKEYQNLIILKAFTKSFAIPGIRLGYSLCRNPEIIEIMENTGPPWSVSVPAQLAGIQACSEKAFLVKSADYIAVERAFLQKELGKLSLKVYPSEANFLLFHINDTDLCSKLKRKGILIRNCANFRGLSAGFYRIAVRTHEENICLLKYLREAIR